jgi:hypothetical protein
LTKGGIERSYSKIILIVTQKMHSQSGDEKEFGLFSLQTRGLMLYISMLLLFMFLLEKGNVNQGENKALQRRRKDLCSSRECWKVKAKARRIENNALKKRVQELSQSRDNWNVKSQQKQAELEQRERELKEIQRASKQKQHNETPKHHHYSLLVIRLVVMVTLQTSASFRARGTRVVILHREFHLLTESPTHTTVANWVYKIGYYELTRPKEQADDWIILLDHSIQ